MGESGLGSWRFSMVFSKLSNLFSPEVENDVEDSFSLRESMSFAMD